MEHSSITEGGATYGTGTLFQWSTIGQGCLGVLTFGIYWGYNSNRMIEIHNSKHKLLYEKNP